nr:hypothetical protein [Tanacetum cinerariifolium]GEY26180.1 hypothetical protein [Tanacetum cinerariifolium]
MRIPLLYRGEYSQWREGFMNYLEEQTDGEAMINSIQNGDQPLTVIAQVSLAGNAQNAPPTLKDPNNETAKDLWDALKRQMCGSEYGEQDRKASILYEYETFKAIEGEQLLDTYLRYLQQNQGDVNDALGYKKKAVVVTSDPLALVAKKTKVNKRKEKVVVSSDSEESGADDFSELKKITALLAKAFNRRKFYSKPTNNNLRTSSTSQDMSKVKCYNCKKEGHFAKDCKKAKVKDYNYYKTKMLLAKKDSDEQVLSESDESSSSAKETIAEKHVEKANQQSKDLENQNKDLQDKYDVLINQVNTFEEKNNEFNDQIKVLNKKNADLLAQTEVLHDQLKVKHVVIDTHTECQAQYAKLEEERYEYMIRYSALCDNDKQHRKNIDEQEILFEKMSSQLVEMNNNVLKLQEKILEKDTKISKLEGCVSNKDVEIEKCLERLNECENKLHKIRQTNQTNYMIMPCKDTLYNGRKGIGFENPSYFEKAKDLRPSLYDEKVIGLVYTSMFLIHSDKALEIEKFKRARENKIEFSYDYGNLNASYVNEKINFSDDYFQEIINPYFKKINSPFQQTSSLKPFRRPKHSGVFWKKKGSSNISNVDLSFVSVSKLNKNVKRYSRKDLLSWRDSVRISPVSKMIFRKKPRDSMNVRSKSNSNKSLPRTVHRWLPKMQPLAEPIAKWFLRIVQICLWIIDSGCSKHMTGNRALLTNFVEKFLGTVRFGNNHFAVIAGYGDVVIGPMTIKKVYYEDGVDLLTGDRSSNLYTIALNEVASNSSTCLLAKASSLQSWLWH